MKKVIGILLVLSLFAGFAIGSGTTDKTDDTKKIVGSEQNGEAAVDGGSEALTEESTTEESKSSIPTIEEQVVFDDKGIVITAKEYTRDEFWNNDGIKLLIENNTEQSITVGVTAVIVNGFMINDLFVADVAPGKKTNETLDLLTSELNAAGITTVGEIEIYFHIYDSNTWEDIIDTDAVVIRTSEYDSMDTEADKSGTVLYDENGILIIGKYVDESSFWGKSVVLYIENNTDKNIIVQTEDLSVNGFTLTGLLSADVYAGKKSFDDITLLSSELEENSITSVDEVALKFDIMTDKYDTIKKTEEITFKTTA